MKQPGEQESRIRGDEEGGNSERLPALRSLRRCGKEALQIFSFFPLPQRNKVRNGSQRKT